MRPQVYHLPMSSDKLEQKVVEQKLHIQITSWKPVKLIAKDAKLSHCL